MDQRDNPYSNLNQGQMPQTMPPGVDYPQQGMLSQQGAFQQGTPQQGSAYQGYTHQPGQQSYLGMSSGAPNYHGQSNYQNQPSAQSQPNVQSQPLDPNDPLCRYSQSHSTAGGAQLSQTQQALQTQQTSQSSQTQRSGRLQQGVQNCQSFKSPDFSSSSAQGAGVKPSATATALEHADKNYSKGARRGGFWRFLYIVALIVLIGSLCAVGYIFYTYWAGQREYDELTEYMTVDDSGEYYTLGSFHVDWDALREINSDVVGWVYVPDTVINYPIVWRDHDDNYYLKRSFGDNSAGAFGAEYGTIMLAGVNSSKWTDQVNVIFGHHLNNGSMFALMGGFTDSSEFNAHRTIFVLTPEGNFKLTTFAVDKVLGSSTDIVIPNFETEDDFQKYVQERVDDSLVTPIPPAPSVANIKQVFAFSTCSEPDNNYRIITFATVDEFLPVGTDRLQGDSLVDKSDIDTVDNMATERTS